MKKIISLLVIATHLAACATYQTRAVPFRPPQESANHIEVDGVHLAAEAFADAALAEETFGFDVREAGLLPVQVVLENKSGKGFVIVSGQTFLIDQRNRYWKLLANAEAVNRVERATRDGSIFSGAGKGAMYGAAIGTVLGLAVGIASGRGAGTTAIKAGALGAASGAVIGGASRAGDYEHDATIRRDLRDKGLEGRIVPLDTLISGFVYFPAEAPGAKALRIQIRFTNSGQTKTVILPFTPGERPTIQQETLPRAPRADG